MDENDLRTHFVEFNLYCPRCKHFESKSDENPCDECLSNPVNYDSRKPIRFQEDIFKKDNIAMNYTGVIH